MIANQFEKVMAALEPPFYVFRDDAAGVICDKLSDPEKYDFNRKRYILTAGNQCTCLGYMKTLNPCKHLQMLGGTYDWVKVGIPGTLLHETVEQLAEEFGEIFPESAKEWLMGLEDTEIPDEVRGVELKISGETKKKFNRIVGVKTFADKTQLALAFVFDNT